MDAAVTYILMLVGPPQAREACRDWFCGALLAALKGLPGLIALDLYTPAVARDPYLDDGPGPLLMLQAYFPGVAVFHAALIGNPFPAAALCGEAGAPNGIAVSHELMRAEYFPVDGEDAAQPLIAPVSYVVRYQRPAEDEAHFVAHYVAVHPPVLGRFPKVRNVICYYPARAGGAWADPTGIPHCDYMLGNEVVFDSLEDLNAALASEARHKLRRDYQNFPPFSGRNTHYAMNRHRVCG